MKFAIGDNTDVGIVTDVTNTQVEINDRWYHKSIVTKIDGLPKKERIRNRGTIDPTMIIPAYENVVDQSKISRFANTMKVEMLQNNFPAIKGYPDFISHDQVGEFFLDGRPITNDDVGKYVWVLTDGYHRSYAALEAGLPYLKTKLDIKYLGDPDHYHENKNCKIVMKKIPLFEESVTFSKKVDLDIQELGYLNQLDDDDWGIIKQNPGKADNYGLDFMRRERLSVDQMELLISLVRNQEVISYWDRDFDTPDSKKYIKARVYSMHGDGVVVFATALALQYIDI